MAVVRPRGAFAGTDDVALEARFVGPWGVGFGADGRVWVADPGAYAILVFTPEGKLAHRIGQAGAGAGRLNYPTGLAITEERLIVCDTNNGRVAEFDLTGTFLHTIGGLGIATAKLAMPNGVAVDPPWVWVANTRGHVVQRYDIETGALERSFGYLGDDAAPPAAGTTDHKWRLPTAIAAGAERVFVLDGKHDRVVALDREGALVWATRPTAGGVGLSRPQGLAFADDALIVADTGNRRLLRLDLGGRVIDERPLGDEPQCVASRAGRLAVTFFTAQTVILMDAL